jgi:hypothetical protein
MSQVSAVFGLEGKKTQNVICPSLLFSLPGRGKWLVMSGFIKGRVRSFF